MNRTGEVEFAKELKEQYTGFVLPITIRSVRDEDLAWAVNSWASSQTTDTSRRIARDIEASGGKRRHYKHNDDYTWACNRSLAEKLILNPKTICLIACDPNDEDQCYGYVVFAGNTLLWIYTKLDFRNTKVASRLMAEAFPMLGKESINITSVTYSISHYRDKWQLELNFPAVRDLVND